jgi:hypothetical protein
MHVAGVERWSKQRMSSCDASVKNAHRDALRSGLLDPTSEIRCPRCLFDV